MRKGKIHFINNDKTACGILTITGITFSMYPEIVNCLRCKRTKLYLEELKVGDEVEPDSMIEPPFGIRRDGYGKGGHRHG